jgi:cytochrome P450
LTFDPSIYLHSRRLAVLSGGSTLLPIDDFFPGYRTDAEIRRDPYPYYGYLREHAPVWTGPDRIHYLSRYDDITRLIRTREVNYDPLKSTRMQRDIESDPATSVAKRTYLIEHRSLGDLDAPDHGRIRTVVADFFSPRSVAAMMLNIEDVVRRLLTTAIEREAFNFVNDIGFLLPVHIVIGQTFDLELEESAKIANFIPDYLASLEPGVSIELKDGLQAPFYSYVSSLIDQRRRKPGVDILSTLISACDQGTLNEHELLATFVILMHGGFDTTRNLLSNGLLQLLRHPAQYAALRDDPSLAMSVVDEVMRFDPPAPMSKPRSIANDISLHGITIEKGEQIVPVYAAANRDPEQFPNPDSFDIKSSPNPHLGFGHGVHLCVGRPLARAEGKAVFEAIAKAPELHLTIEDDFLEYRPEILQRSLIELPVSI